MRPKERWSERRRRVAAVAAAVAIHILALAALVQTDPARPGFGEQPVVYLALGEGAPPASSAARSTAPEQARDAASLAEAPPPPPQPDPAATIDPPPAPPAPAAADPPPAPVEPSTEDAAAELASAGPSLTTDPMDDGPETGGVTPGTSLVPIGGSGADCGLAETIGAALQEDAEVLAALGRVPRQSRSVANAVMLWDGDWVPDQAATPGALDPVRAALSLRIEDAPESCRAEVLAGPIFIPLRASDGTVVLTIGSGVWRWGQLVDHHVR
ncbi:MAG: hypothetical protein KY449_06605 [Proteobacteria bacterium]|nr:hypothetical protein [Pseudomonadota bacterium]